MLAFFIVFVGVVYQVRRRLRRMKEILPADEQLPGGMAYERSSLLTSHLEAMGCRRSARIMCVLPLYSQAGPVGRNGFGEQQI